MTNEENIKINQRIIDEYMLNVIEDQLSDNDIDYLLEIFKDHNNE